MAKLVRYVNKHRAGKNKNFNFQALVGGKFLFDNKEQFVNFYCREMPKLTQKTTPALVFRPCKHNCPLFYCDLDFRSKAPISIPNKVLVNITHELLTILKGVLGTNDVWKVILTKRTGSYYKGGDVKRYCGGFHILCPDLL